jgi:hypothetical protein
MDAIINTLVGTGISGVMLAFFIWYLNKQDSAHKEERKEWTSTSNRHVEKFTEVVEKNTTALIKMEEALKDARCRFKRE